MWVLRDRDGIVICKRETAEEIGKERLWYENRGYTVTVERVRLEETGQSFLV